MVGDTVLVSNHGASSPRFPNSTSSKCFDTTVQQGTTTFLAFENETAGSLFIREPFRYTEIPSEIIKLSWKHSDHQRHPDMSQCLNDGTGMQYQGIKIPILQM